MVENLIPPVLREGVPGFKAVEAATAIGLGFTNRFILPQDGSMDMSDITFQAVGAFTVLTADLEVSLDGGVTFSVISPAIDFIATPASRNDLGRTGIYRFNILTLTGGPVDIIVAAP